MAGFANLLIEVLLSHVLPSLGSCLKMFQLIITMIIVIMCKKRRNRHVVSYHVPQ